MAPGPRSFELRGGREAVGGRSRSPRGRFYAPRDPSGVKIACPEPEIGGPTPRRAQVGERPRAHAKASGTAGPWRRTSCWAPPHPTSQSLHLFISRHWIPRGLCHAGPSLVWPRVVLKGPAPQLGLRGRPNDKG